MNLTCHAYVRACVCVRAYNCVCACVRACVCTYVCTYVCLCICDVVATLYTCFMSHTPFTTNHKHKPVSGKVDQFPVMSVKATKQREEKIDEEEDEESEDCEHMKMCDNVNYTTHTHEGGVLLTMC